MSWQLRFWCGAVAADLIDVARNCEAVELLDRERDQKLDPVLEQEIGRAKGFPLFGFCAFDGCRIRHAPMSSDRVAGPDRAGFPGRLVAHGKDEIHDQRVGPGELVPAFAAELAGRQTK